MTKFSKNIDIQWHFFKANHEKGAVNGVGEMVKHSVYQKVLSKQVVIEGPRHFATYTNKIITYTKYFATYTKHFATYCNICNIY